MYICHILLKDDCLILDCGIPSISDNAIISFTSGIYGNTSLFAIATYECDLGFILSSSAIRNCTETSDWLPEAPNCTRGKVYTLRIVVELMK